LDRGDDDDVRRLCELEREIPDGGPSESARSRAEAAHARSAGGGRGSGAVGASVPATEDLGALAQAAKGCTACDLYKHATQVVFGRGPRAARVVLVGEQPGDQEDRQGAPFVGPAGEVLDRALAEANLDRGQIYVTNVVKHFKFVQRGKRRIHEKPGSTEVAACRPWLDAELSSIRPDVLVCLGATAANAIFGRDFRLLKQRGQWLRTPTGLRALATIHPSAVLRGPDEAAQAQLYAMLVEDLGTVAAALGRADAPGAGAT
jgi:DNA polymerase